MAKLKRYNKKRMVVVFAMVAIVSVCVFCVVLRSPETETPQHPRESVIDMLCAIAAVVLSAPALPFALFFTKNPPWYIWVPLALGTWLFWTFLVEWMFYFRSRWRERTAAEKNKSSTNR